MTPIDWLVELAATAQLVPVSAGEKAPRCKGWPSVRLSPQETRAHAEAGGNVALRLGAASGDLVDTDLDCAEALALADLYLPPTAAIFGRPSRPASHRLYRSPGAVFAAFADPTDGDMLVELRADGRDGGGHLTLLPPSSAGGERREWFGDAVEPATINAAVLTRRVAWLAIGCLVSRHVSECAARTPTEDSLSLLWKSDPALGRAAYRWIGRSDPTAPHRRPRQRVELSRAELDLADLMRAIPNDCGWIEWNATGMAIFAASGGSEQGLTTFTEWSSKSSRHDPRAVDERWRNYRRSPPSRIGIGTLVYRARQAGWQPQARVAA